MGLMIFHPHIKEESLARISAPMLAIIGEYDVISKADTQKMVGLVQRGDITVIHHGTHFFDSAETAGVASDYCFFFLTKM